MAYTKPITRHTREATGPNGVPVAMNVLNIGNSLELHDVSDFARVMGLFRATNDARPSTTKAINLLRALGVPLTFWCDGRCYFSPLAFEKAMFLLASFGGPGFAAPNTLTRFMKAHRKCLTDVPVKITSEMVKKYGKNLDRDMRRAAMLRGREAFKAVKKAAIKAGKAIEREASDV